MNSRKEKLHRLLDLYSVESLREGFNLKGQKSAVLADAASRSDSEIEKFARVNFPTTRQHAYCYENSSGKLPSHSKASLLTGALLDVKATQDEVIHFYLMQEEVEYIVDTDGALSRQSIELFWPVQVHVTKRYFLVRCTILERDVSQYLNGGRPVGQGKRKRDDSGILTEISKSVNDPAWTPLDLNKGIKALWHQDVIDAFTVRYKKARSTSEEEMDGELTVKANDLAVYRQLISRPLHAGVFLCLKNQDTMGRGFYCHPTSGVFRFLRYAKGIESSDHVLGKVLSDNF